MIITFVVITWINDKTLALSIVKMHLFFNMSFAGGMKIEIMPSIVALSWYFFQVCTIHFIMFFPDIK